MAESVDAPDLKSVDHYGRGSSSLPTRTINILGYTLIPCNTELSTTYAWYNEGTSLILVYLIQNVPFTFDELPNIAMDDPENCK